MVGIRPNNTSSGFETTSDGTRLEFLGDRTGHDVLANHRARPEQASRPPPPRSIMVPVDGSPAAESALPAALALARRSGAEVALVNVYSTLQAANDPELLGWRGGEYLIEPHRDYLEELAGRLTKAHAVRVRPVLLKGYLPEDTLCEMADWEADLVVLAARRRGWWSRVWHGSVSAEVARRSRAPVLVVPATDDPPDLFAEPPLGRVLVPLDGSARAERALGPAAALAALTGGECKLLRVIRAPLHVVDWSLAYGGRSAAAQAAQTHEARRYLRDTAGRLKANTVPARWRVVTDERPAAEAIVRYAERGGADVIALAGADGSGLAGLFRGDPALRVARLAPVPVLVCPAR